MNELLKGREFQLWDYLVSHGRMLVRSPNDQHFSNNIDITFAGVEFVSLPRYLPDLFLAQATVHDIEAMREKLGERLDGSQVHVFLSGGKRFFVVAAHMDISESDVDMMEVPYRKW